MKYSDMKSFLKEDLGLTIKDFEKLVGSKPKSLTNYTQRKQMPRYLGIVVALMRLSSSKFSRNEILEIIKKEVESYEENCVWH